MAKPPTIPTRPGGHERFMRRAREFSFGMQAALEDGHPDLALSTAAHCVIAACDAILAKKVRSAVGFSRSQQRRAAD